MRGIIIAVTIVLVVAIVMYGIVQIKRGKVETPSQVSLNNPYAETGYAETGEPADVEESENFTPVEEVPEDVKE